MEFGRSVAAFLWGILRRFYVLLPGVAFGGLDVFERTGGHAVSLPNWVAWTVIGLSVFIAAAWSYHDLRMTTAGGSAAMDIRHIKDELAYLFQRLDELDEGELELVYYESGALRQPYIVLPTQAWNSRGPALEAALGDNYEAVRDAFIDVDRFNRVVLSGRAVRPDPNVDALRQTLKRAESLLP